MELPLATTEAHEVQVTAPDYPAQSRTLMRSLALRYVIGTSTQDNAFNSDLGGVGDVGNPSNYTGTWESFGFSPRAS